MGQRKAWTPACLTHTFQHNLLILILSNCKSFSVLSFLCYNDHLFHLVSGTLRLTHLILSLPTLQMLQAPFPTFPFPSWPLSFQRIPIYTQFWFFNLPKAYHPRILPPIQCPSLHACSHFPTKPGQNPRFIITILHMLHSYIYFPCTSPALSSVKTTTLAKPNHACTLVAKRTVETYSHAH